MKIRLMFAFGVVLVVSGIGWLTVVLLTLAFVFGMDISKNAVVSSHSYHIGYVAGTLAFAYVIAAGYLLRYWYKHRSTGPSKPSKSYIGYPIVTFGNIMPMNINFYVHSSTRKASSLCF